LYHKNKENKFLFFLFSLQNQGIPVNEIYEKEGIKDIPTERFKDIMVEENGGATTNQSSMIFSFYSDDSYEPISNAPDPLKNRPKAIPTLNLLNIPSYESSSDEEEDVTSKPNEVLALKPKVMNTQDYEQSMKYIENYYSKCTNVDLKESLLL
jgi:hypothetical protein